MGDVRIAGKFGDGKDERCPRCSMINQNFIILNEHTWVCMKCGMHFTPKTKMEFYRKNQKSMLWERQKGSDPKEGSLVCDVCGKSCKSPLGLASHKRSHDKR